MSHIDAFLRTFPLETLQEECRLTVKRVPSTVLGCVMALSPLARASQEQCTAVAVNVTRGAMDSKNMQAILSATFPGCSPRVGGHHISHARTGVLGGKVPCRYSPARRSGGGSRQTAMDLSGFDDASLAEAIAEYPQGSPERLALAGEIGRRKLAAANGGE